MMAEAADIPVVTDDMVIEPKKEMDKPRDGSPVRSERGRSPEPRAEREPFSARSRGGAPSSSTGEKAPSIYVRGLGKDCQPADLFPIFEKYGEVDDIYLPRDYHSRDARGFGYIQFKRTEDAEEAMRKIDFIDIGGRQVNVEWARGGRKTPGEMRGSGREPARRRYSRSPRRRYSRSPPRRRYSRSPPRRRYSRSPPPRRRYSRSPPRRRYDDREGDRRRAVSPAPYRSSGRDTEEVRGRERERSFTPPPVRRPASP